MTLQRNLLDVTRSSLKEAHCKPLCGTQWNFYLPRTNLREGNIFTGVCLWAGERGSHVTITHALDLNTQGALVVAW